MNNIDLSLYVISTFVIIKMKSDKNYEGEKKLKKGKGTAQNSEGYEISRSKSSTHQTRLF